MNNRLSIVFLVLALILGACSKKPDTAENQDPFNAFEISKDFIKDNLTEPAVATAKWPPFSDPNCKAIFDKESQLWIVKSYVDADAQNIIRIRARMNYTVKLKYIGNAQWQLIDWNWTGLSIIKKA